MQKFTRTLLGQEAREALKRGIDAVAIPVSKTIGAMGRNGAHTDFPYPSVTNDGVTIARQIIPEDNFERIGADLIKQAAERTNDEAGDGTTTTTILSQTLIEGGLESGESPIVLKRKFNEAKEFIVEKIKEVAKPIKDKSDILSVARISVEDEHLAEVIAEATEKAGKYGAIIVEEGAGYDIEKEEIPGYFWDRGYVSPYMITNPDKNEAVLEEPVVLVTDRYMNLNKDLVKALSDINQSGAKSALIVADNVEGELLGTLIHNKLQGTFTTVVVKKPESTEELEDLATLTGATAVTKDKGIKEIESSHFGKAKRVVVSQDKTTLITDETPALTERVKQLSEDTKEDNDDEKKKERLAKLADGIVVLRVGAKTESERRYKKLKVDDAVNACRSAQEGGIVEGAGVALYKIAQEVEDPIVRAALEKPYKQILENAGIEPDGNYYNVLTGKKVKDLIKEGIIDPAKVEWCSVENAISFASTYLSIESVTAQFEEEAQK